MLWKVLFWKQVLAHPREIPQPALSWLSISPEAMKDWGGSINPLLWTFRALTAWQGRGLHTPQSRQQSPGLLALTGNNFRAQPSPHSASLPQSHTAPPRSCLPACLPLYDSPAEAGRIRKQRQACLLAFLLSPPYGNSSLGGFPYMVSATPLQILQPPPNPIPPF